MLKGIHSFLLPCPSMARGRIIADMILIRSRELY